jgi:hypothetical protein
MHRATIARQPLSFRSLDRLNRAQSVRSNARRGKNSSDLSGNRQTVGCRPYRLALSSANNNQSLGRRRLRDPSCSRPIV